MSKLKWQGGHSTKIGFQCSSYLSRGVSIRYSTNSTKEGSCLSNRGLSGNLHSIEMFCTSTKPVFCAASYCSVLYCAVLYCTVLYCTCVCTCACARPRCRARTWRSSIRPCTARPWSGSPACPRRRTWRARRGAAPPGTSASAAGTSWTSSWWAVGTSPGGRRADPARYPRGSRIRMNIIWIYKYLLNSILLVLLDRYLKIPVTSVRVRGRGKRRARRWRPPWTPCTTSAGAPSGRRTGGGRAWGETRVIARD